MTTADAAPKCCYCGMLPHPGVCPTVKAIEYYEDGTVKRVEFKSAADYVAPSYPVYPLYPSPAPTPWNPWPITCGSRGTVADACGIGPN